MNDLNNSSGPPFSKTWQTIKGIQKDSLYNQEDSIHSETVKYCRQLDIQAL